MGKLYLYLYFCMSKLAAVDILNRIRYGVAMQPLATSTVATCYYFTRPDGGRQSSFLRMSVCHGR